MNSPLLAFAALALASLLPAAAQAQPFYRCGNTYSQIPCAADATTPKLSRGAAPDLPPGPHGKDLCASAGLQRLGLDDADGRLVASVVKGRAEVIRYAGQPMVAHRFEVTLNTKDGLGADDGPRVLACFLSEDEQRVLEVRPRR